MLTPLRVSNTAHLPTKPNQVAKAGRLKRKPKNQASSLQFHPDQRENKTKKSKLTYWLNYNKAAML